MRQVYRKQ